MLIMSRSMSSARRPVAPASRDGPNPGGSRFAKCDLDFDSLEAAVTATADPASTFFVTTAVALLSFDVVAIGADDVVIFAATDTGGVVVVICDPQFFFILFVST